MILLSNVKKKYTTSNIFVTKMVDGDILVKEVGG
jgi:hypothetical protein